MHWDGAEVRLTEEVERSVAPKGDEKEKLWVTYYSHIFNPARVKPKAMQAQLLKRNWKNLPEAVVIEPLMREAGRRSTHMIARSEERVVRRSDYRLAEPPRTDEWAVLREAAGVCTACPLYKTATCTVFGEGPNTARVMLVGEQPGDQEDREGRAFVGPAGQLLNRALASAGIDREQVYVTNAVKHFKWEPRGKRRIHKTASARDIASCRPWLEAEVALVRPELIVCLGATALHSVFGAPRKVMENRGRILESELGKVLVTVHPSSLLRLPDPSTFEADFGRFVEDLRKARVNMGNA
jgi:DNA polymerase